jgi:O-antigen/teichoic acid export membrane protein
LLDTDGSARPQSLGLAGTQALSSEHAILSQVFHNGVVLWTASVISKGLLFLWQIMLARLLGAHGYGLYGTIGAMLAIGAAIPDLGVGTVVIRDVARHPKRAGRYLTATLALQPALAVAGYGILITVSLLGYGVELALLVALAALGLVIDVFGNIAHNQMLASDQMVIPSVISIGHILLMIAFGWTALNAGGGIWGLYLALLTAGIARSVAYVISLRRQAVLPEFPVDGGVVRHLLANGLPLAAGAFLALAGTHLDKLLTTALIDPTNTGYLTAGYILVFGLQELVSTPCLVAAMPTMSRWHAQGNTEGLHRFTAALMTVILAAGIPAAISIAALAGPLAQRLFGAGFEATTEVLAPLAWLAVVAMADSVFAQVLTVQNRQSMIMRIRAVALACNALLAVILLPAMGVRGAAVAALVADLAALLLYAATTSLSSAFWSNLGNRLWRLVVAGASMTGTLEWARPHGALAAAAIGILLYLFVSFLVRAIRPGDLRQIQQLLSDFISPLGALGGRTPTAVE